MLPLIFKEPDSDELPIVALLPVIAKLPVIKISLISREERASVTLSKCSDLINSPGDIPEVLIMAID